MIKVTSSSLYRKVVHALSTAGISNARNEALWILEEIGGQEIDFVSLVECFDTTHPKTKLIYYVMVTLSKMEREMFLECVNAGRPPLDEEDRGEG